MEFKDWLLGESGRGAGARVGLYPPGYEGQGLYPPADQVIWSADSITYMLPKTRKSKLNYGPFEFYQPPPYSIKWGLWKNPFDDGRIT